MCVPCIYVYPLSRVGRTIFPRFFSLISTTTRLTFFFIFDIFPRDSAQKLETESGIQTELECGRDFREAVLSGDWNVSAVSLFSLS